ncbi:hypothetical protein SEPCBS119000_005858 [Sporothrix epigloea]|uniref:PH domain-containing protein n=1 Tax=Sporothrix epigloea TaxID=1892477 RepID=A0ABP0E036_9PEZI
MAEEQKPVDIPAVEAPAVVEPVEAPAVVEAPSTETTAATEAPVETSTVDAAPETGADTEAPAAVEEPKKEAEPIEEGVLEAKGSGFPKSLLYTKKFFWFPKDAQSPADLATYLKSEKATDVAHHVVSWASETGKGLLFYGEKKGEKPHGVIHLADASEPTNEGTNKFQLTAKGHKHVFKAPTAADRDNWVAQIKAKIAEAKELATSVTESESYKTTLASLKPVKKEEAPKAAEPVAEEATTSDATPEATVEAPTTEAAPETTPVEVVKEEKKPRSSSRKRTSIFGSLLGGKKDEKKDVAAEPVTPEEVEAAPAPAEEESAEVPAVEAPVETSSEAVAEPAAEVAAVEAPKEVKTPPFIKRASIFGSLSFNKKKAEAAEVAPAPPVKDVIAEPAAVSETAPVIPAVEATAPLSTEDAPVAEVPATEAAPEAAVVAVSEKKEAKADKRKSSLPFNFGSKKDKSDDEGEKKSSGFSRLRNTVLGSRKDKSPGPAKTEEAAAAAAAEPSAAEASTDAAVNEAAAPVEAAAEETTSSSLPVEEAAIEAPKPIAEAPIVAATA